MAAPTRNRRAQNWPPEATGKLEPEDRALKIVCPSPDTSIVPSSRRAAAVLFLAVAAASCSANRRSDLPRARDGIAPPQIRVRLGDGSLRTIDLEEYVRGSVISELAPAGGHPDVVGRMLEVQAVIARSFAVAHLGRHAREGFDLCSTTHCQLYQPGRLGTSRWAQAATDATRRTKRTVLWYRSGPASALYHADCGGYTSAARQVWGGASSPYLAAVRDDGAAEAAHVAWRFEVEGGKLAAALNRDSRTRVGARLDDVVVLERDEAARARLVALRGAREPIVRGEELRLVLSRTLGATAIRSTKFEITRQGSRFVFSGRGFGHGAGLCQVGAMAHIRAGATPAQVLARYYPGTSLVVLR
jgi:stage II sporulation protein D